MSEGGYTPQPLLTRVREASRRRGLRAVAGDFARWGTELAVGMPWMLRGSHRHFTLAGRRLAYLHLPYKLTWLTERAVEVPFMRALVAEHEPQDVLEIGNVLSHYGPVDHLIVDKYETAPGVANRDVLDLKDLGRYKLIVAISTLEHVGRDEEPQDPDAAARALNSLTGMLSPGGRLALTVPLGYNPDFDRHLRSGEVPFSQLTAIRRTGPGPRWREVAAQEAWGVPYDYLLYSARAVLVAELTAPA